MSQKVEELREELYDDAVSDISDLASAWGTGEHLAEHHMKRIADGLDSLIAAAREEGAEQERERIRKMADYYEAEDPLPYAELVDGNYVGASCEIYVVPVEAFALAPKEESK